MPDSLLFNGTTNYIRFGPGTIVGTGPLTVVFIVKISTDAADFKNFLGWNATDGFFQMGNANPRPLGTYTGANLESSAFTVSATEGWIVVGFSVDDTVEKLKPYAAQYKMNYPVLVGMGHEDVQDAFGPIWGIPVSVIIGRDGKIAIRHSGIATKEQFEREIKALL